MSGDVIRREVERICERVDLSALGGARVLLTGASGLLGSYLLGCLEVLKDQGEKIDVHAQVLSEPPPHVQAVIERGRFSLLRADLGDFRDYERLPEADVIIHGAGYAQPLRFMSNPGSTLQINTAATLALLQKVRAGGHFLFMSSVQVYTGVHGGVCREAVVGTTTPAHPRASYIEGKRAGEAACYAFRSQGLHATAARLGDIYGPGTRTGDKRALNSFIEQALTEGEIRMLDAGNAVRTYGYVSDAIEAMWKVLLNGRETVYNVGGCSLTTIADLARTVARLAGVRVTMGPAAASVAGSPEAFRLDLTKVETEFGRPEYVDLEQGLATTIDWQRGLY